MSLVEQECVLCRRRVLVEAYGPLNQLYKYKCENCGNYLATDRFVGMGHQDNYHLLSGYSRSVFESGNQFQFRTDNYKQLFDHPEIPKSILEKADKLLLYYFTRTEYYSHTNPRLLHPAICYAKNERELFALYDLLEEQNFLVPTIKGGQRTRPDQIVMVTNSGIARCDELQRTKHKNSKSVFVAMWFGEDMRSVYDEAIAPAIKECGYTPIRVDNIEHNNDITDEIIAGIRESRFVVADMTGYRGGVYYEAGFAHGLGLPVIFTCRQDWFAGEMKEGKVIKEKIHFDINHQNIIVWDSKDELKTRVINRIRATII